MQALRCAAPESKAETLRALRCCTHPSWSHPGCCATAVGDAVGTPTGAEAAAVAAVVRGCAVAGGRGIRRHTVPCCWSVGAHVACTLLGPVVACEADGQRSVNIFRSMISQGSREILYGISICIRLEIQTTSCATMEIVRKGSKRGVDGGADLAHLAPPQWAPVKPDALGLVRKARHDVSPLCEAPAERRPDPALLYLVRVTWAVVEAATITAASAYVPEDDADSAWHTRGHGSVLPSSGAASAAYCAAYCSSSGPSR
jgi:hypothetical protein